MRSVQTAASLTVLWSVSIGPAIASDLAPLVDRVTWGRTPAAVAQAERLGAHRWLRQQLYPRRQNDLPPEIAARIAAMRISSVPMGQLMKDMGSQNMATAKLENAAERQAARQAQNDASRSLKHEAASRSLLRNIYSANQLREQMIWFWFNHFNIQADKRDIRVMIGDYEEQAIRPNALGKFRDLLRAAETHPAMLRYLDNDQNAVGHVNENFAREILELHTMGVESGYTQKDVEETARVLTGLGISVSPPPKLPAAQEALYVRRGIMEFNPARHDFATKEVLGSKIEGSGFGEVEDLLDMLAKQPATAKHVSTQLATYFMGEAPATVVDPMSRTFLRTDGDIAQVLETLFRAPAFKASLGKKLKDPVHYVVSTVRLLYGDRPISDVAPVRGWIADLGQGIYGRETPDGYPLDDRAWAGPGQLASRFDVARKIQTSSATLFQSPAGTKPPEPLLQQLPEAAGLQSSLSAQTKMVLGEAQSPSEWITLYLSSPEFLHR